MADAWLAKLDAAGMVVWARSYGGGDFDLAHTVAVDGSGNVVVGGVFRGTMTVGSDTLQSTGPGDSDAWLAKLDPAGTVLWTKDWGDGQLDVLHHVDFDTGGSVLAAGNFSGAFDFGGGLLTADATDMFVVELDDDGGHVWSRSFGGGASIQPLTMVVDGDGNVFIGGYFDGDADFGFGPVSSVGGDDGFVLALDAAGVPQWARIFDGSGDDHVEGVAVDPGDNILVVGAFRGTLTLGGMVYNSNGNQNEDDAFAVKLTAGGNDALWVDVFTGNGDERIEGIALMPDNSAVLVGHYTGTAAIGMPTMNAGNNRNLFAFKLSP
jgi:hypothetical protein